MNPKVDFYFQKAGKWQKEIELLRTIVLGCNLSEVLKWGVPCYAMDNRNIVLIHIFKDYCALLFFKGALMKDPEGILIQQTANVQAARQIRFTHVSDIIKLKSVLKTYIHEAIEIEKAGLKVAFKKNTEIPVTDEFQCKLDENPVLKTAFETLTPGRQRAYHIYFSAPKQSKTREARITKSIPKIIMGKGLNDD